MIVYAKQEAKLDSITAHLLAQDVQLVTGYLPQVTDELSQAKGSVIYIGTINSNLIKSFGSKTDIQNLSGKWECFQIKQVEHPTKNVSRALIVAGSDLRGMAYGVFDISAKIGVTPWYYWADVTPVKKQTLSINLSNLISEEPSVKYRGIFINDEDWGLQPWAAKVLEPETGDIGPKTYAKVFELLLRLKANLIWPAMHYSTKAFFHYPGNPKVAEDYQIVVGSSHAEPMLRNNVSEWNDKTMGRFNYLTNQQKIDEYWKSRVKESSSMNSSYTLGMRGVSDGPIEGVKTVKETVPLLERIFNDQREMLQKYVNKDITKVPQVFTPYKEVLEVYDGGLKVPDDVTLVWPDDNYGYIQRLSDETENKRSGGSGVYYHIAYYGRPHDYQWLCTNSLGLMREEMTKAYEMNARKLWVLNVGDIKPAEYETELFLNMAYQIQPFLNDSYLPKHLNQWVQDNIDKKNATPITNILWKYYQLTFERKPEFMGWSQTEPTTPVHFTTYNHFNYNDQAQLRIDAYNSIETQVKQLRSIIPANEKDRFYQLVYYPVMGASLMTKKFLYRDKAYLYAAQGRSSATYYDSLSRAAYKGMVDETDFYNTKMSNGKWANMMTMDARKLPALLAPELNYKITPKPGDWLVIPEGYNETINNTELSMPAFNRIAQRHFIDVFLTNNQSVAYTINTTVPWVNVSQVGGKLLPSGKESENRVWISVNWSKVPAGINATGKVIIKSGAKEVAVTIKADNKDKGIPQNYKGFIEDNGYISIYAKNYQTKTANGPDNWSKISGLGEEESMMEALPLRIKPIALDLTDKVIKQRPHLDYAFYTFNDAPAEIKMFTLPTFPLNRSFQVRYAVSVDDGPVTVLNFKTVGRSEEWKQAVLSNTITRSIKLSTLKSGNHYLHIYMIDPGVILDRILIDLGGLKPFYGLLPETTMTN